MKRRPNDSDRDVWLTTGIVDCFLDVKVGKLPEIYKSDILLLPSQFNPLQDKKNRKLAPFIIYPMFGSSHFCLMVYSRYEEELLLLGMQYLKKVLLVN